MQLIARAGLVVLLCISSVYGTRTLKQSGCFFCDLMSSFGGMFTPMVPTYGMQSAANTCDSVWEVISSNDDLSIFAKAVKRAGFKGLLRDGVLSSTVFAPTNAAMKELLVALNATQKELMHDPSLLPLISYHIVNANIPMAALNNGDILDTLLGTNVTIMIPGSTSGPTRLPKPLADPSADAAAAPDAAETSADSVADASPDASPDAASAGVSALGGAQAAATASTPAGTGVSARAPAPGPAGSILRKIFRVEPRSSAAAPQTAALDDGADDAAAAASPADAALQESLNSLQSAVADLTTSIFQAGLNISDAVLGAFNGSMLANNRTLAAGQLRIRGAQTTANVVRADIVGCQGYVNIIDRVLFPEFLNETITNRSTTFLLGDGSGTKDPVVRFTMRRNVNGEMMGGGSRMSGGSIIGTSEEIDDGDADAVDADADAAAPSAAPAGALAAADILPLGESAAATPSAADDASDADITAPSAAPADALAAAGVFQPLPVVTAKPLTPLPARTPSAAAAAAPKSALGFKPLRSTPAP